MSKPACHDIMPREYLKKLSKKDAAGCENIVDMFGIAAKKQKLNSQDGSTSKTNVTDSDNDAGVSTTEIDPHVDVRPSNPGKMWQKTVF